MQNILKISAVGTEIAQFNNYFFLAMMIDD